MKVRLSARAIRDVERISAYLHERNPAAARSVVNTTENRIHQLLDSPFMAPRTDEPDIRELSAVRYPYKIYYRVRGDQIVILHIRDARRAPWKGAPR